MNSGERYESPRGELPAALPAATEPVEGSQTPVLRCLGCGRPVRSEAAKLSHNGGRCRARRLRAARLADALGWDSAAQLLIDGGLVHLRRHGGRVWAVSSSDGSHTYLTTASNCNCPCGLVARYTCYHQRAVQAWEACGSAGGWADCDRAVA